MTELLNVLNEQLEEKADQIMMVDVKFGDQLTGLMIREMITRFRYQLAMDGIGKGDVVMIALENSAIYLIIEQALWECDAIAHPIAPSTQPQEVQKEFNDYHYTGLITESPLASLIGNHADLTAHTLSIDNYRLGFFKYEGEKISHYRPGVADDDQLATILNTSGSTGRPKRVGLTYRQLLNSARHIGESQDLSEHDNNLVVMPMFHVNAQVISILATRISGGGLVIVQKFSASRFWQQIADYQITWASVVPTIIQILLENDKAREGYQQRKADIRLRYLRSASFSLPATTLAKFQQTYGLPVREGYGMTETASLITLNPLEGWRAGTVGYPVATEIALLVDGQITNMAGKKGEILLRGDHVIMDYLDPHPESFIGGWLRTGDLGVFDTDGRLQIVGRLKDIISRGGEKVAPLAIEAELRKLPFIADVTVVGLPDELYGEEVTAVIIKRPNEARAENELRDLIFESAATTLTKPARPTKVIFVDAFPKNATGKVIRPALVRALVEKEAV